MLLPLSPAFHLWPSSTSVPANAHPLPPQMPTLCVCPVHSEHADQVSDMIALLHRAAMGPPNYHPFVAWHAFETRPPHR